MQADILKTGKNDEEECGMHASVSWCSNMPSMTLASVINDAESAPETDDGVGMDAECSSATYWNGMCSSSMLEVARLNRTQEV